MALFIDARIPVVFAGIAEATPSDALLLEDDMPSPHPISAATVARFRPSLPSAAGHVPGCLCCVPRQPAAEALGRLFLARVRGDVKFFDRVVACVRDPDLVRAALAQDQMASARFRLA
jgi:hypothetical protein